MVHLKSNKRVLISSNYAWTIKNFRLPLIKALTESGYRVHILTEFDGYEDDLKSYAESIHNLSISRKGVNPISDFITVLNFFIIMVKIRPNIALFFTIKPVIYGSIVARILKIKTISTITGIGTVFIKESFITRVTEFLYSISIKKHGIIFFQNKDDLKLFNQKGITNPKKSYLIPGSGVDTSLFKLKNKKEFKKINFLMIARIIWDKGIKEYVAASELITKKYPDINFSLLGPLGVQNRSAIKPNVIEGWVNKGLIKYIGEKENVRPYIEESSCIVLPSYREGLSRILLEAAAMSSPIITTDVPGCRELVDDNISGFICRVKDHKDLANKMEKFIQLSHEQKSEMGNMGRIKIVNEFDIRLVIKIYMNKINTLLM